MAWSCAGRPAVFCTQFVTLLNTGLASTPGLGLEESLNDSVKLDFPAVYNVWSLSINYASQSKCDNDFVCLFVLWMNLYIVYCGFFLGLLGEWYKIKTRWRTSAMKIPPNRIEMVYADDWMFLYLTSICNSMNIVNVTLGNVYVFLRNFINVTFIWENL